MSFVKRLRIGFGAAFAMLLLTEVLIALFVHDSFVRPYLGDVLAVATVYCAARTVLPVRPAWMSAAVTALAFCIELIQLTDLAALFGEGSFMAILLGSTFDIHDLLCYAVGGAVCAVCDILLRTKIREKQKNDQL